LFIKIMVAMLHIKNKFSTNGKLLSYFWVSPVGAF